MRNRIEAAGTPPNITVGEDVIYASVMLPLFYERRTYWPVWSGDEGPLTYVDALIQAINAADQEGLIPGDYHLTKIMSVLHEVRQNQQKKMQLNPGRLTDLDLLLTDAFLIYGAHLLAGRVDPVTIDPEWNATVREADLAQVLETAIKSRTIAGALENLLPPQVGYMRLRQALARYREIATQSAWPLVPVGPTIKKGNRGERVVALRRRLRATGDLEGEVYEDDDEFDDIVEHAVRRFQKRHGLDIDGVVGSATLAALNIPVESRIRQIELNMERWRWLPQDLGQRYILINIANFELDVMEMGKRVLLMRAVVGRPYRRTPVFSDYMTYLVLNPYWHVPAKIAIEDMLPQIRNDVSYFLKQNIKVFQSWGTETKEIDPQTVDWSRIADKNFNFRFRQDPGSTNALGRIKFMFPNKYNVYIHDTPAKELFAKAERGFSSGCIRIEKPLDLAEYVLRGDPKWTRERITAELDKNVEQTVRLPTAIPVHLLYWTAWTNEEGSVYFRNDIYERDRLLDEALREPPLRK